MRAHVSMAKCPQDRVFDPVLNSISHSDFEEIPSRHQSTIRLLRCSRSGISIYIHLFDQYTPFRSHYVVAYEGEKDNGKQIQQIILESDQSRAVFGVLNLINEHVRRVCRQAQKMRNRALKGDTTEPALLRLGRFHRRDTRERIRMSLVVLSQTNIAQNAYQGFVNAVLSHVDDWLLNPPQADRFQDDNKRIEQRKRNIYR